MVAYGGIGRIYSWPWCLRSERLLADRIALRQLQLSSCIIGVLAWWNYQIDNTDNKYKSCA